MQFHPADAVPIFLSEDGRSQKVGEVVAAAQQRIRAQSPDLPFIHEHHPGSGERYQNGYFKLAAHYKWALDRVFLDSTIERVIILEEDLLIANDFFEYFAATMTLLDEDESLMGSLRLER